ncbi:MAG: two-component regulator propeller domain-containing protein [Cytophagales bacterium]|nr:two-component regulator propeller domain-containing protein [Cytophagales bacterium]
MKGIYYLFLISILICFGKAEAQHFPSKQYMIADGMPSNSIYDIAQDNRGMMWFVTKVGPVYYDARQWYTFPDSLNLPKSTNSLMKAVGDRIWVVGLNDTSLTVQYHQDGWNEISVPKTEVELMERLFFDVLDTYEEYEVLLGFKTRLFSYSSKRRVWEKIALPENLLLNNIRMIGRKFLLSTSDGLYIYDSRSIQKVQLPYDELPSDFILNVEFQQDIYYLLGYNWFAEMTEDTIIHLMPDAGLNEAAVSAKTSIVVNDDIVLFGANTPARLVNWTEGTFQDLLFDGKKLNIGSTRVLADNEGNIWVSDTRGLFKFNLLQFENYNSNSGLKDDEVTVVHQLANGKMILANIHQLNVMEDDRLVSYPSVRYGDANFRVLDIHEDRKTDQIMMTTSGGGLIFYDINDFQKPATVLSKTSRVTSVEAFKDKIFVANNQGLQELTRGRLIPANPDVRTIRNMSVLGDKLGLYTTGYGVYLYDGREYQFFSSRVFGLRSVYDGVVYQDEIILGSSDGLATFSEDQIVPWEEVEINSPVFALLTDKTGNLWIGVDHGVYRYDGVDLELFDIDEGLLGNEINRNALFEDRNGHIWIGTEKGVSVFKGESEMDKQINLAVTIEEVLLNGNQSLLNIENPELDFDDNNLQIAFQCLSYVDEERINYRYRITTTDDQWIQLSREVGSVTLTNLEYGTYQFEVQARFGNGEWGDSTVYNFEIKKPFYYRWWFYLLGVLTLIAIARTVFYFRYVLLIKKQRNLKALIAARTREIQDLNDHLEEKVKERTKELQDKNLKLEEYAFINAHHLRAPLAKIMSAVHVVEKMDEQNLDPEILKILKDSIEELDQVIYSINDIFRD